METTTQTVQLVKVDVLELAAMVARVAAESPDWENRALIDGTWTCVYLVDGHRCLVGEALSRLGVDDDTLDRFGEAAYRSLVRDGLLVVGDAAYGAERVAAHAFIVSAQGEQDSGRRWGAAVASAAERSGYRLPETVPA